MHATMAAAFWTPTAIESYRSTCIPPSMSIQHLNPSAVSAWLILLTVACSTHLQAHDLPLAGKKCEGNG